MKIGENDYYYDISRNSYIVLMQETQEIQIIESEHIKKAFYKEFLRTARAETLLALGDEKGIVKEFREYEAIRKLNIEMVNLEFAPHKPSRHVLNGFEYVNTYLPSEILSKTLSKRNEEGLLALNNELSFIDEYPHINALLDNLFVNTERKLYFLNWLSCALVTRRKNRTAIVLRGIQGSGKGVLWENIIEYVVGKPYSVTISNDDLSTNFNSKLENKLFVLANEIKGDFRDGNNAYEKLKMYITDSELRLEQKGIDARRAENYFNVLITSNNATPLQIQGGDRRYTVYETSSRKITNLAEEDFNLTIEQFIDKIIEERDDFIADLLLFNFNKELAGTAQETDEKQRIYRASMTKAEILVDKIKGLEVSFFLNDFLEVAEALKEEDFFNLCEEKKIVIINESVGQTVEYTTSKMFADIDGKGYIETGILQFFFEIFTGERSATKIGTTMTAHFGQSRAIREGDSVKRVRDVKINHTAGAF